MIRFFLGTLVPFLFILTQLLAAPVKPPTLAQTKVAITAKGGIRNPMREKPEGVIPVGQEDFFYFGSWHSIPTKNTLKVGNTTTLTGYEGTTWTPPSSLVETGSANAFFILADGSGNVKWALSSCDGDFDDMAATVVDNKIYVALGVRPIRRAEKRTDNILAKWVWGSQPNQTFQITEAFVNTEQPKDFIAPRYTYIVVLSLNGEILSAFKPFEDAHHDLTKGDIWYSVRRLFNVNNRLILDGKVAAERSSAPHTHYTLKYGTPEQIIEGESRGKQILTQIDLTNPAQPQVLRVDYATNQETLKSYSIDAIRVTEDALYFSMTCSNGGNALTQAVHFLDQALETAGQLGGHYLVKTDRDLQKVAWVKKLPKGTAVTAIAHSGEWLYVAGDYDKEVEWGTTKLLNDNNADNLAFWGTVNRNDGSLGQAQYIQAGYAENVGIVVTDNSVVWQFDHRITSMPGMGADGIRELLFGDGKQYATSDALTDEDANWVAQMGLAIYNKNTNALEAFTHTISSETYLTIIPTNTSVGRGSPILSGNGRYVSFIAQTGEGTGPTMRKVQLFDEAFPTPKDQGYGNFCAFYGTLKLPVQYTLTVKASTEGITTVTYRDGNNDVTKTTEAGDLHILLEENTLFTLRATPNTAGKEIRFQYDPTKMEKTNSATTFKLLADVTVDVLFFDPLRLTIEEEGKQPGMSYHLYQNDSKIDEPAHAAWRADDLIRLEIVALGYSYAISAEGATLVSGTTYKVTGNAQIKIKITYTKDDSLWRTVTFTNAIEPQGKLAISNSYSGEKIKSGASVALGATLECMLVQIPLGYKVTMQVTGLNLVQERKQPTQWGTIYFYDYTVTDNATVTVHLEKDETLWHTIAFSPTGTDAQGLPYTLKLNALTADNAAPINPNEKLPKGAHFACYFTTTGGAYPTLAVTGAKRLTGGEWDKYSLFVYEVEADVQVAVASWEIKQVPVTIDIKPKTPSLGRVEVSYMKDGVQTSVNNGDLIPWGTICKILVVPNPGVELKSPTTGFSLQGFVSLGDNNYRLESTEKASIEAAFKRIIYNVTVLGHEGINLLVEKLDQDGEKEPIVAKTKLYYGDKLQITATNTDEENQWLQSLQLSNLEKVEGQTNIYTVTGNVSIEPQVVKLFSLTLKSNEKAKYSISYLFKGEEKSMTVENGESIVKVNELSTVTLKVLEIAPKHILQGVKPSIAMPATADPMSFTFVVRDPITVEVLTEALQYCDLTVRCGENGKLAISYTEPHATLKSEEIQGNTSFTIEKGTTINVKAFPNEHFRVAQFKVGANEAFPQEGGFLLTTATEITIAFERIEYPVSTISHRGKGTLRLTTLERTVNVELKSGDKVWENEKLQITYEPDPAFDVKPETLKVEGLEKVGDAYRVTGAVSATIDFVPRPMEANDVDFIALEVMPNPFSRLLRIKQQEFRKVHYALRTLYGSAIRQGTIEANEFTITTDDLPTGVYLLQLTTDDGHSRVLRVVKQ